MARVDGKISKSIKIKVKPHFLRLGMHSDFIPPTS